MKKIYLFVVAFSITFACLIYAFYEKEEVYHEVNFYEDEFTLYQTTTISNNDVIDKPDNPTKANFIFDTWLLEEEVFDFDSTIKSSVNLYASWIDRYGFIDTQYLGFTFRCFNDKTASLLSYNENDNNITIPKTVVYEDKEYIVTTINQRAFENNIDINEVVFPDSISNIEEYAFYNCTNLSIIELPEGLDTINSGVFRGCTSLTQIILPSTLKVISEYVFYNCSSLVNIALPNNISEIKDFAFLNCKSLKQITFPFNLTKLGEAVFKGCSSLETVLLNSNLEVISKDAFGYCTSLKSISLSDNIKVIESYAFYNCVKLSFVYISSGLTSIEEYVFAFCPSIESFIVDEDNDFFKTIDGALYSKDETVFYKTVETSSDTFILSSNTEVILPMSFCFATFKTIVLSDKIEVISSSTFYACEQLIEITLPSSLDTISSQAFFSCEKLEYIYIPGNVINILSNAFSLCNSLTIHTSYEEAPSTWHHSWNSNKNEVVWGV